MDKQRKIKQNPLVSVGGKLGIVSVVSIVALTTAILFILIPNMRGIVSTTAKTNLYAMAQAYSMSLEGPGAEYETYEEYKEILGDIEVEGVPGSYAYLTSSDGTLLYHPDEEKVGEPVTNEVIQGVVAKIAETGIAEQATEEGVMQEGQNASLTFGDSAEYEYNGDIKYAGYQVLRSGHILVVTGTESAVMSEINELRNLGILSALGIGIVVILILAFFINAITKQMMKITETVYKISEFDYTTNEDIPKLLNRKDEIGKMAVAVQKLLDNMRIIITDMNQSVNVVTDSVKEVNEISNRININSTDNSATTEELAAGMQETTATTASMEHNISEMNNQAMSIDELAITSKEKATEIQTRAQELKDISVNSSEVAKNMYESIKGKTNQAIEDAKAVEKMGNLPMQLWKFLHKQVFWH